MLGFGGKNLFVKKLQRIRNFSSAVNIKLLPHEYKSATNIRISLARIYVSGIGNRWYKNKGNQGNKGNMTKCSK